jgi:hypothetical protein
MARWGSLTILVMLAGASAASAQTPPQSAPPATAAPAPAPERGRGPRAAQDGGVRPTVALNTVQNMLDGYVLKQAQPALQLSDSQWVAFVAKMDVLQKLRRDHQRQHTQLINQLNQAAPPPNGRAGSQGTADEATIAARVKAVDDLEAQMATEERAALAAVDSVLTVYQRARFRVFEENMEREKIRLLGKVMNDPGGGGQAPATKPGR